MRRLTAVFLTTVLAACSSGGDDHAADQADAMPAPTISLADVAGTWNMVSMADTMAIPYVLMATEDPAGWTVAFPDGEPIPVEIVLVDGDSIVTLTGPFESVIYEGEMLTTRSVMRLHDGMLMGTIHAVYDNPDIPDLMGTSEGSRAVDTME